MKNSILILGIALVAMTNVSNARNTDSKSVNLFKSSFIDNDSTVVLSKKAVKLAKPYLNDESEMFNPETVIAFNRKTVKEIITEGDKITEYSNADEQEYTALEESMKEIIAQSDLIIENTVSDQRYPLYIERTIEDEIAELEQVIESKESNEVQALDFKKIDKFPVLKNSFNNKKIIGMN